VFRLIRVILLSSSSFFFHDTAPTEIYTLSLHDALPIYVGRAHVGVDVGAGDAVALGHVGKPRSHAQLVVSVVALLVDRLGHVERDRKSTRLNSSHVKISYAVFCLKKKKSKIIRRDRGNE